MFLYVKVYIFQKFIQYTMHWDCMQMLKKFRLDKINVNETQMFKLQQKL